MWTSQIKREGGCLQIRVQTFCGRISGASENSLEFKKGGGAGGVKESGLS